MVPQETSFFVLALFFVIAATGVGCAGHSETVRRETIQEPAGTASTAYVEKTTVIREDDGSTSVLGSVFNVIGEVIALPFRIVAGVFRFIF